MNVDAEEKGDAGFGLGFLLRDRLGDIVMADMSQEGHYLGAESEESRVCVFAFHQVQAYGHG